MDDEKRALRVIQCAVRCSLAKRQHQQLRKWWDEDQKWRLALKRRRQRIERLERELRHVENLSAVDVDRYAVTAGILKSRGIYRNDYIGLTYAFVQARYGMRGLQVKKMTLCRLREQIYRLV